MAGCLLNVQALRGVACLLVVLYHLQVFDARFGHATPGLAALRWFGFAGVDLFFVLSGFVITATNRRHLGRPSAVPGYLFRRFWRIYPTYWAGLLGCAVVGRVAFGWEPFTAGAAREWPAWLSLAPLAGGNPLIGQAWTLSYEVMFYAAFGTLLCAPPRAAAAALGGWAAVAAAGLLVPAPAHLLAELPVSPFVLEFLGGCLVAHLAARGVSTGWRAAAAAGVGYAAAGVVVVAASAADYGAAMAAPRPRVLVFGPAAVLLVYAAVAAEGRWPRRVPRWLLRAGDASYSLYLTHMTVLLLAVLVGLRLPHATGPHLLWLAGALAVTLVAGFLFHAAVERPLLRLARARRSAPPAGPTATPLPTRRAA